MIIIRSGKSRILKHVLIVLLIFSMIITPFAIKPEKAEGLFIVDYTLGKVLDITLVVVSNVFMDTLGYVAEEVDNDTLNNVYGFLNGTSLLGDPVKNDCEKILAELDHISNRIDQVQASTDKTLNKMFAYEIQGNANKVHGELDSIYNDYSLINDKYVDYASAVGTYSDAMETFNASPTEENQNKMKAAKSTAETKQTKLERSFGDVNYLNDIKRIAELTCKTFPDNNADHATGKNPNSRNSYLYEVWTLLGETVPFDHQKYDGMTAAINDTARPLTELLMVNQIYLQYMTAEYNSEYKNAVNDGNINDKSIKDALDKKEKALNVISDDYGDAMIGVTQCLNDISGQYSKEMSTLMTPYDSEVTMDIDYKNSGEYVVNNGVGNGDTTYTTDAKKTMPKMDFYRVRVGGNNYLVLKNYGITGNDFTWKKYPDSVNSGNYYLSQDFYNLRNTKDGCYYMFSSTDFLKEFVNSNSYDSTGKDVSKYIRDAGQLANANNSTRNHIVSTEKDKHGHFDTGRYFYETVYWYSQYFNPATPEKSREKIKLRYIDDTNMIVILRQAKNSIETNSIIVKKSDERGKIEVTDKDDNPITGKVKAGTQLKIKVTLNSNDVDLAKLAWVSEDGKKEDVLATADIFNAIKDKDNSYTFTYTMPYQKCTFSATFAASKNDGSGTEDDPYIIRNYSDFYEFAKKTRTSETSKEYGSASYILSGNIDMTDQNDERMASGFDYFSGTFDGNGYVVSGFLTPMFRDIKEGGKIKNLTVDANGNNGIERGVFADRNDGTIDGCSVICTTGKKYTQIKGNDQFGLLANSNGKNGTIKNCFNLAEVYGTNCSGLVDNNGGSILNCYNLGKINHQYTGKDDKLAGIASRSGGTISNCYYGGGFTDGHYSPKASGFAPILLSPEGKQLPADSYYDEKYKLSDNTYGIPLKTEQMTGSDYLLDKLNKEAVNHSTWKSWQRSDDVNGGYPYFGSVPIKYDISTDIKGEGNITITSGDSKIKSAAKDAKVEVALSAGEGYEASSVDIIDKDGAVLESPKIEKVGDKVSASFEMPGQDIEIAAVFSSKDEEESNYGTHKMTDKATGVRIYGKQINDNAQLIVKKNAPGSAHEDTMEAAIGDDVLASYDIKFVLKDDDGINIKTDDPTFKDDLYVYFPIKEHYNYEELKVVHGPNTDYEIIDGKEIQTDSEDLYRVHVKHLSPFALVDHTDEIVEDLSAPAEESAVDADSSNGSMGIWAVVIIIILLAGGAVIYLLYRRNKKMAA